MKRFGSCYTVMTYKPLFFSHGDIHGNIPKTGYNATMPRAKKPLRIQRVSPCDKRFRVKFKDCDSWFISPHETESLARAWAERNKGLSWNTPSSIHFTYFYCKPKMLLFSHFLY